MRTITTLVAAIVFLMPTVAYAARDLRDIICQLVGILNNLVPIIIGLALLYFFWGLARFILNNESEEERARGKRIMLWGTVAFFVALSIFGIVQILLNTFFGGTAGGFESGFICGEYHLMDGYEAWERP